MGPLVRRGNFIAVSRWTVILFSLAAFFVLLAACGDGGVTTYSACAFLRGEVDGLTDDCAVVVTDYSRISDRADVDCRCSKKGVVYFWNEELASPGDSSICAGSAMPVVFDRYTITYVPDEASAPVLAEKVVYDTFTVNPTDGTPYTRLVVYIDEAAKSAYESQSPPGDPPRRYTAVFEFHGRTELGEEVEVKVTDSFEIGYFDGC